ncbi:hypothetical protein VC35_25735 [Pseudomonas fluorescens]|uniref:Uncharacterized protein n=1 Tax=Pseudomonas fluorescens TaxID=294 RepID=A0A0F4T405_PSEFL|nr:hypothetical protein VC35_25735 [Pseudomonas fluorescens]
MIRQGFDLTNYPLADRIPSAKVCPEYKACPCIGQYYDLHKPTHRFVDMDVGYPCRQRFDADLHPERAQQVTEQAMFGSREKSPANSKLSRRNKFRLGGVLAFGDG